MQIVEPLEAKEAGQVDLSLYALKSHGPLETKDRDGNDNSVCRNVPVR